MIVLFISRDVFFFSFFLSFYMYDLTIHGLFVFINKLEILLNSICSEFSVISSLVKTKIQWAQHVGVSSFQLHYFEQNPLGSLSRHHS